MNEETFNICPVVRINGKKRELDSEHLACEASVAFVVNGQTLGETRATPRDLEELGIGWMYTNGIISDVSEILSVGVTYHRTYYRISATVHESARRDVPPGKKAGKLLKAPTFSAKTIMKGFEAMEKMQHLRHETGATHAMAWLTNKGEIAFVMEDAGRHNALDKLIGKILKEGLKFSKGGVLASSRASHEMVDKCTRAKIGFFAAVSAPTKDAVEEAHLYGMTLIGFARDKRMTIYSNDHRIV